MEADQRPPDPGDMLGQTIERPIAPPGDAGGTETDGASGGEAEGTDLGGRPMRPPTIPDETVYRADPAFAEQAAAAGTDGAPGATAAAAETSGYRTSAGDAALPGISSLDESVADDGNPGANAVPVTPDRPEDDFRPPDRWADEGGGQAEGGIASPSASPGFEPSGPGTAGLEHRADEARRGSERGGPTADPASEPPGRPDDGNVAATSSDGDGDGEAGYPGGGLGDAGADHGNVPEELIGRGDEMSSEHGRGLGREKHEHRPDEDETELAE